MVMWLFLTDNRVFSFCFFFLFFSFLFFFFSFFFLVFCVIFLYFFFLVEMMKFVRFVFQFCFPCVPLWEMKKKNKPKKAKKKKWPSAGREMKKTTTNRPRERKKITEWAANQSAFVGFDFPPHKLTFDLLCSVRTPLKPNCVSSKIKGKQPSATQSSHSVVSRLRFPPLPSLISFRRAPFYFPKINQNKTKQNKTKKNETEPDRISTSGIHLINNSFIKTKQKNQKKPKRRNKNMKVELVSHCPPPPERSCIERACRQVSGTTIDNNNYKQPNQQYIYIHFFLSFCFCLFFRLLIIIFNNKIQNKTKFENSTKKMFVFF